MRLCVWTSVVAIVFFIFTSAPAIGAPNPAAVYCREMGYGYSIEKGAEGEHGTCLLPDMECDEWEFLSGKCGKEHSYCAKKGYGLKTDSRGEAVCLVNNISGDGKKAVSTEEIPVGKLMNLEGPYVAPKEGGLAAGPLFDSLYNASDFSYWDWRNPPAGTIYNENNFSIFDASNGWLTGVKDQGGCGSCWAFSSVGAIEARYELNENNSRLNLDLSEEYMVSDCHPEDPYYSLYQDCCGGYMEVALNFTTYEGIPDETCFPYVDASSCTCSSPHVCSGTCTYNSGNNCSDAACSDRCSGYAERLWTIGGADYSSYWTDFTNEELEQWILDKGPLTVGLGIGGTCGGYFDGDIYRCSNDNCANHGVVMVGYNDTGNDTTSYWILKNSWGTGWGAAGYYKLGFNECNITEEVHYVNLTYPPDFRPAVEINGPASGDETNYDTISFNFTICTGISNSSTCDLFIDGGFANTTSPVNGTPAEMSSLLSPGTHSWHVKCWESGIGVANSSETRNITVMVPPGIIVSSPQNSTYEALPLSLNITTNETADWCGWNLNGTDNATMTGSGTVWWSSITPPQGTHQVYVYCNDSVGNMGQNSSLYFTYLPESPKYWDNSTNSTKAGSSVEFSLRWTDNTELSSYIFSLDNCTGSFANVTGGSLSGTNDWSNETLVVNGTYGCTVRWKVYANDTSGNWNISDEYSFVTKDETPPTIQNTTLIPNIARNDSNLTVTARITDNNETSYAFVRIFNTSWAVFLEENMSRSGNDWFLTLNVSGIIEGLYYLNLTAVDYSGNNATEWIGNLTVNDTAGADTVLVNNSWSTTGNYTILNLSSINITLEINTSQELENVSIGAASYTEDPISGGFPLIHVGKYAQAETSQTLEESLIWVIIKFFYNSTEVSEKGLDEDSLRVYWYNETGGNWTTAETGGVNTTDSYVWTNTTHFSFYGIFGSPTTTTTTTSTTLGGGGGGGSRPATTTSTTTTTLRDTTTSTTLRPPVTGHATETSTTALPLEFSESRKEFMLPDYAAIPMAIAALVLVILAGRKPKAKKFTPIERIISEGDRLLGKKILINGSISPMRLLDDGKTAYTITDVTGRMLGLSKKDDYKGEGIIEGRLKKARNRYYVEF